MWDSIQKLQYRADAGIASAQEALELRMTDRLLLPLKGIHGETLYLTGLQKLNAWAEELEVLFDRLPDAPGEREVILLDAWSSATIEGARTTVDQVRRSFANPKTRDDRMVINTVRGSQFAFEQPISVKNIRTLWETVVDGVCENQVHRGMLSGTVWCMWALLTV